MNNSDTRDTEYTGNDNERAKHPLTVQEQARAMRREGLANGRPKPDKRRS